MENLGINSGSLRWGMDAKRMSETAVVDKNNDVSEYGGEEEREGN